MSLSNRFREVCLVILILICVLAYGIYWAFFDVQRIKGQELLGSYLSPDQTYEVTTYLNNGGATVDYAVLGVVTNQESRRSKNIYWQYHCQTATVEWLDDRTVKINDIVLDVEKDIYDYRRE
ncbi:MAG: DUF5412 domain-containing protein [Zhenhengia sp.]|jgi:hypothetical protein|uniref:DUF5412 domain-containing protein n=1 Tax=Zhenhengia sp. TaxID=2944208 RepID=UPI0029094BF1|nr:DUF5412 domain-containing protein [Clostridiales bacterium]MDU6974525.1 DUF5412 domain-containing protein [Clostridiales bacterium]